MFEHNELLAKAVDMWPRRLPPWVPQKMSGQDLLTLNITCQLVSDVAFGLMARITEIEARIEQLEGKEGKEQGKEGKEQGKEGS